MKEFAAELNNVSFRYGNSDEGALHSLNMKIKKGECVLLCGASGCGKTTITRLLNGLIPHYYEGDLQGDITVLGRNIRDTSIEDLAGTVGSVFQNPRSQFFCVDTTAEIAFGCENMGLSETEIQKRIENTVTDMRIEKLQNRSIFNLSGGEKQKIACAGVSAMQPELIVLDELSSNLDLEAIDELRDIIAAWKSQGKTIVIAEHRLYFLRELADRMVILENGKIIKELASEEIKKLTNADTERMGIRPMTLPDIGYSEDNAATQGDVLILEDFIFTYKDGKHGINIQRLELPMNSIIAITGQNGAGKSTLIRNICGLERRCKGVMELSGKRLKAKDRLHTCYMIMQDVNHQLFTESVREEVILSMTDKSLTDEQKRKRADEILLQLDLAEYADRHPMALSGGQKQRTAIASGIASSKPVIILDEPTSGLDLAHMEQVADQLKKLKDMGRTVIVVTHDNEFILSCCDHIVRLENGCAVKNCPLDK